MIGEEAQGFDLQIVQVQHAEASQSLLVLIEQEEDVAGGLLHVMTHQGTSLEKGKLPEKSCRGSTALARFRKHLPGEQGCVRFGTDRQPFGKVQTFLVFLQHIETESMEGGRTDPCSRDQCGQPFPHFPGSLVGEGQGEDLLGSHLPGTDLIGYPVRER